MKLKRYLDNNMLKVGDISTACLVDKDSSPREMGLYLNITDSQRHCECLNVDLICQVVRKAMDNKSEQICTGSVAIVVIKVYGGAGAVLYTPDLVTIRYCIIQLLHS